MSSIMSDWSLEQVQKAKRDRENQIYSVELELNRLDCLRKDLESRLDWAKKVLSFADEELKSRGVEV